MPVTAPSIQPRVHLPIGAAGSNSILLVAFNPLLLVDSDQHTFFLRLPIMTK